MQEADGGMATPAGVGAAPGMAAMTSTSTPSIEDAGHLAPMGLLSGAQRAQGSALLCEAAQGDAALLLGGDLTITVFRVRSDA